MKNNSNSPLVSVIMPVYNAQAYLSEAIDSILNQTYTNIELIIVDDGSTDSSRYIIKGYQKEHPSKVHPIFLKKNLGRSGDPATQKGILKARGEYIAKMDSDDIATPDRIARQVHYLEKNIDIFLVGAHARLINKDNEPVGVKKTPTSHSKIYQSFYLFNNIIHPTILFRNTKETRNFYKLKFDCFNEYYTFFYWMSKGYKVANIPQNLIRYRIHDHNDTFTDIKSKFNTYNAIRTSFEKDFGYNPTLIQRVLLILQRALVAIVPAYFLKAMYLYTRKLVNSIYIRPKFNFFRKKPALRYAILK